MECCLVHFPKHTSGCGPSAPLEHKLGFIRTLHHRAEKKAKGNKSSKNTKIKKGRRHQPRRNRTSKFARETPNITSERTPDPETPSDKKTGSAKEENTLTQAKEHLSWFTPPARAAPSADSSSNLYLRPRRRTVPRWIVVLTSVGAAWLFPCLVFF